jgi:hypothetical protein
MKKISIVSCMLLMVFTLALATSTFAQEKKISRSIANQQHRIDQAIAKGRLAPGEVRTVQGNLDFIRSMYEKALAQGTLRQERGRIMGMLHENGRMIGKKKHAPVRRLY